MKIIFTKDYLQDLYEGNVNKYKLYNSNPQLVKQYVKTVNKLISVTRIEQLQQFNSLRYAKKIGDLKGFSAVRINDQYRLLFKELSTDPNSLIIDVIELEEISKHYE